MSDAIPPTDPFLTPGAQAPGEPAAPDPASGHHLRRDEDQDLSEQRKALVARWTRRVTQARAKYKRDFDRMRANTEFVLGAQWSEGKPLVGGEDKDNRYVANVALRHVQQNVASLYPNNPTMKFSKRDKLIAQVWDGDAATLAQAQGKMQQNAQAAAIGLPPLPLDPQTQQILADFQEVQQYDKMLGRVGKTLQILWDYNIDEQVQSFKSGMKMAVRRGTITGVGYVKLGFQRAMQLKPEIEQRIADMTERLANVQRLAADIGDGEVHEDGPDAESLRIAIQSLRESGQMVIREGLTFDYPDSWAIIPDPKCRSLKGFLGADWVAQEYLLRPDEIEEVWQVDVGKSYTAYSPGDEHGGEHVATSGHTRAGGGDYAGPHDDDAETGALACVWEIYNRKDGTVYTVCDGYKDFLVEPHPPEAFTDHFWPWYGIVLNEAYHARRLFPLSDIDLLRDMQMELNRARQGLREQRHANRPAMATAAGALEQEDKDKIRTRPANALLELNGLAPGAKVADLLQAIQMPEIQPQLYDTAGAMEDMLRVLGDQAADTGTTAGATATEVSTAEASQHNARSSVMDDLDDMLSLLAKNGGQILLLNVSEQIVKDVVGPGAVWPQLNNITVAKNVYLEVVAGSSGRPNKQAEVMNLVQVVPLLQRIPGISPEWLARQILTRMDDRIDLTDAFVEGVPSMEQMNRNAPAGLPGAGPPDAGGPGAPSAQGPQGAQNAQAGPPTNGLTAPRARDPITSAETQPVPGQPLGVHPTPGTGAPTP